MKFCVKVLKLGIMMVECENFQTLKIQDGGQYRTARSPVFYGISRISGR